MALWSAAFGIRAYTLIGKVESSCHDLGEQCVSRLKAMWLFYLPERSSEQSTTSRRPGKRLNDESCQPTQLSCCSFGFNEE